MKSLLVFGLMAALTACSKKPIQPEGKSLVAGFQLTNPYGIPTTTFHPGEDLIFSFAVVNQTERAQPWRLPDTRPFAIFEVYLGEGLIGTTVDGYGFFPVVVEGELQSGGILAAKDSWLENGEHRSLTAGNYTLVAKPQLKFDDFGTLPDKKIDFEVVQ